MKRVLILFSLISLSILAACDNSDNISSNTEDDEKATEPVEEVDNHNEKDIDKSDVDVEANAKEEEMPEITEEAMNHAYDVINGYEMVKDPYIEVSEKEQKIILAIQVNAATNEEHAKNLGDNFVRALASGVSIYSEEDMEAPSKKDLGEIYNYYDLQIGVGTDPDNFLAQGAMVKSASKITW